MSEVTRKPPGSQTMSELSDLLALLYKGAMEDPPWESLLRFLQVRFDATAAVLSFAMSRGERPCSTSYLTILAPQSDICLDSYAKAYTEEFFELDPLYRHDFSSGEIMIFEDLISADEFRGSRFYREFLLPYDAIHGLKMCIEEPDGLRASFTLSRNAEAGNFTAEDKLYFTKLIPHFEQALQIHSKLFRHQIEIGLYSDVINQLLIGVLILDGYGKPIKMNRTMERFLGPTLPIAILNGQLCFKDQLEHARIHAAIQRMIMKNNSGNRFAVEAFNLGAYGKEVNLLIKSIPISKKYSNRREPHAVIYLRDPRNSPTTNEQLLMKIFSLTPAESRIAISLASGLSISDTAAALGVHESTVRTQTKRIFSKTGASRQGELVLLINQSVAQLGELPSS